MRNKLDIEVIENITMLLQVILGIYVISFGIAGLFVHELILISEILIGLLMFVIAYNNQKIYKRKYMTYVYFGLGILIIVSSLLT